VPRPRKPGRVKPDAEAQRQSAHALIRVCGQRSVVRLKRPARAQSGSWAALIARRKGSSSAP
jgi:hypothetical protein